MSNSRLVAKGQQHFHVFNLGSDGDDNLQEVIEDTDCQYEIEASDKIFRISISKDGRYLLANISSTEPRIEMYDLDRKQVVR